MGKTKDCVSRADKAAPIRTRRGYDKRRGWDSKCMQETTYISTRLQLLHSLRPNRNVSTTWLLQGAL